MCGRYVARFEPDAFERAFGLQPPLFESHNVAPGGYAPIVRAAGDDRETLLARWGLVPRWVDRPVDFKANLFNARSETLLDKASFKRPLRSQRCLVPAAGFYEWRVEEGGKTPYYVRARDGAPLALAGLWDVWEKGDEPLASFTVLTTRPNGLLRKLHDRMPVILPEALFADWLEPELDGRDLLDLLGPCEDERLIAHPVDRRVGRVREDDPGLTEPVGEELTA